MIATKEGNTELVSLLLDAGANPDIQNKVLHAVFYEQACCILSLHATRHVLSKVLLGVF